MRLSVKELYQNSPLKGKHKVKLWKNTRIGKIKNDNFEFKSFHLKISHK